MNFLSADNLRLKNLDFKRSLTQMNWRELSWKEVSEHDHDRLAVHITIDFKKF